MLPGLARRQVLCAGLEKLLAETGSLPMAAAPLSFQSPHSVYSPCDVLPYQAGSTGKEVLQCCGVG